MVERIPMSVTGSRQLREELERLERVERHEIIKAIETARAHGDLSENAGNTVVVIEHNLDVIKTADYVIDIGPEGGDAGGEIIATGTPEEVAACPQSYTGKFLQQLLQGD